MCGITGIIHCDPTAVVGTEVIEKMCRVIHHRGPDDMGVWCNGGVGIGMTRLSIIDRAGGRQPIHNEDKSCWIVFNGEIYNFLELRRKLVDRGHTFVTNSDTETILHLYEDYQEDCVSHLRGMFAFAIWDEKEQKLFLARDRLGIKPMHYFFDGRYFVFGSEIKSILKSGFVGAEVYPQALVNYFFCGYIPDPDTMFKGIKKLPPGHLLTLQGGKLTIRQYWDVRFRPDDSQPEEYFIERVIELIREAVRIRLVSEVPLGAFLSGGIDSSLVVAFMAQEMSQPVKTFSIGFEHQKFNELPYARMVAERYGTDHHEEVVRADAEAVIFDLIKQFDEPFADSSAIPTYYVSRMTKQCVTVSLSGDGGDEFFGGYDHYRESWISKLSNSLPSAMKKRILRNLARILPEGVWGVNTMRYLSCSSEEQIFWKYTRKLSLIHDEVFHEEFAERVKTTDPSGMFLPYLRKTRDMDRFTRLQYLDTKMYLPGDILTKVDRTSMLVSLEARVPLLDHKLVEFAATIPTKYKISNSVTKYLLKRIAERFLPREVIYRPKRGFAVPIQSWINNEWAEMSQELVLGERALARKNFNPKFLHRIMSEHRRGRRDHSHIIWALMVLELWFREFVDK